MYVVKAFAAQEMRGRHYIIHTFTCSCTASMAFLSLEGWDGSSTLVLSRSYNNSRISWCSAKLLSWRCWLFPAVTKVSYATYAPLEYWSYSVKPPMNSASVPYAQTLIANNTNMYLQSSRLSSWGVDRLTFAQLRSVELTLWWWSKLTLASFWCRWYL